MGMQNAEIFDQIMNLTLTSLRFQLLLASYCEVTNFLPLILTKSLFWSQQHHRKNSDTFPQYILFS